MPMATSTQSPNDLTRQQLDELDDLLQRMLSLPLNPPESFAPTPAVFSPPMPTAAPIPRESPVAAPAPRVFAPPVVEPQESQFVFKPAPAPAPITAPGPESMLAPISSPISSPFIERAATIISRPAAVIDRPPPARSESIPFLYAPLVGFNAVLNWTLGLFGFPGRVLRSGFVKCLFGIVGFGLLIFTGLKVAQIHGLVTLPQELPWPPR